MKHILTLLLLGFLSVVVPETNNQVKHYLGYNNVKLVYNWQTVEHCFFGDCQKATVKSGGTGFYVRFFLPDTSERQLIITNAHVCGNNTTMLINEDGQEKRLKVVKVDRRRDLCALKPTMPILTAYLISPFNNYIGQSVYIMGHPHLLPLTFREGHLGGYAGPDSYKECGFLRITSDLITYPGNSGSPILDPYTHMVVGVLNCGYGQAMSLIVPQYELKGFILEYIDAKYKHLKK